MDFQQCGEDHLGVESINIEPYPAHAGDRLTIVVKGTNDIDIQVRLGHCIAMREAVVQAEEAVPR